MACGTSGKGRLPDPQVIVEEVASLLAPIKDLNGLSILITSGPTREPIDPVRYISNNSSGKMGFALADASLQRGAHVTVISGPVSVMKPPGIKTIDVETAEEMYSVVLEQYKQHDVVIMAAAVSDYRCAKVSDKKIKKANESLLLELIRNPDIAGELGKIKEGKIHIGFCAETNDLVKNAKAKISSKNFDMIVANDVMLEGAGFGVDTNIVKLIKQDGSIIDLPLMSKVEVAHKILDEIVKMVKYQETKRIKE
jgi:phosphopantothenoylcysteine decarboxylase / phosphopantothenate---cysteine ligase